MRKNTPLSRGHDADSLLVACHDCGTVHVLRTPRAGHVAYCRSCATKLRAVERRSIDQPLALDLTALVLFIIANSFPFITMEMQGQEQVTSLVGGALALREKGMMFLAIVVLLAAVMFPLFKIMLSLFILLRAQLGQAWPGQRLTLRLVEMISPWAMSEVYLLGVIVAYVKLKDLATIHLGVAMLAFVGMIVTMIAAQARTDVFDLWERIAPQRRPGQEASVPETKLVACHGCGQLEPDPLPHARCPRCHAALHPRKADSLQRTWALVIAAAVLYVPANLYPVMTVHSLGQGEPDTILSGVVTLFRIGMWPIALLVFFASVTVPVLKLIGLTYLLVTVQRGSAGRLKDRTRIYRIIESVGRWSMVDIFMIAILTGLVNLGQLASIDPGFGAVCFAGVVILTMLASLSFDPRLMWDRASEKNDEFPFSRA